MYMHPPPNIGPSNLSSLWNIKFTKNVTLPHMFSCILLAQSIYLVSLHKWDFCLNLFWQAQSIRATNNPSQQLTAQGQQYKHCSKN